MGEATDTLACGITGSDVGSAMREHSAPATCLIRGAGLMITRCRWVPTCGYRTTATRGIGMSS